MIRAWYWKMRIKHESRGIEVTTTNSLFRQQHYARESLLSRLKALMWSQDNPQPSNEFTYTLEDDDHYPDDLAKYRKIRGR